MGIGKILKDSLYHYETFFELSDCIFNMVLSRLIDPCSKRGVIEFQKDIYDLSPFEFHQYYRSLDYLIKSKNEIEKNIFDQMIKLLGANLDMAFFDTTTIIYYGDDPVVYYNEERAKLDKAHREELIKELKEKTKNGIIYSIISNTNYKRYLDIEGEDPKISKNKINQGELYDGVFVITTNTKLGANQVVSFYRDLWHVEQGFKWLKSELEMEPIYHWKDDRIRAHIMVCFITLILKVFLNKKLKKVNEKNSYPEVMTSLKRLQVIQMKVENRPVYMTTTIESKVKEAFKAINLGPLEKNLYDEYSKLELPKKSGHFAKSGLTNKQGVSREQKESNLHKRV